MSIWINRITGKTTVMGAHSDWPELSRATTTAVVVWDMICRSSRPLF